MTPLRLGATVLYVTDVPASVEFYRRALGLEPRFYDEATGFAELGPEGFIAVASHEAGEMMMPGAYPNPRSGRPSSVEIAFYTDDVPAAFRRAVEAGGNPLTEPRLMPWGQMVAYVQSVDGTILGLLTPPVAQDTF